MNAATTQVCTTQNTAKSIGSHVFMIEVNSPAEQLFYFFYFAMTGLHATHMIIGIGILSVMLFRTLMGRFSADYATPIDLSGLYRHFVDIIWVFLFAIFYIPGGHLQ